MTINDKIKQVLIIKNLSPSHLADDIGIQRSSISHILSGRNRPSLDIIQRIVRRFPEFTYDWFLEDDLQMTTTRSPDSLSKLDTELPSVSQQIHPTTASQPASTTPTTDPEPSAFPTSLPAEGGKTVDRILLFYTDGTFQEYRPTAR